MIFFYYGTDSFRSRQKVKAIAKKFQEKVDQSGHSIENLDGEEISADDFFRAVSVFGFLSEKKLIVVKNIFNNKKLSSWQEQLIDFLKKQKDTPEENYIVFWQTSKPDLRGKLYKTLSKFKFVEEFEPLRSHQLNSWVKKQVKIHQGQIEDEAVELLVNYVGNNLWQMNQEIQKLTNFSSKAISAQDVRYLVQAKVDENIFNLVEALGNKNKALALSLIESQINHGVNHQYILTMMTRQFRLIIKAKSISGQTKYPGALAQALKMPPTIAKKIMDQSQLYDDQQLKKIYQRLLVLDEKFKTSQHQEKILFTQIINEL